MTARSSSADAPRASLNLRQPWHCLLPRIVAGALSLCSGLSAQNQPGIPYITNFSVKDYGNQHAQNWAVVTDNRGILYFGNGNGVLEYDGSSWRIIPTTNKSLVRALARDSSGRIYAGGLGDFGYLARDSVGGMMFRSLLEFVEEDEREFGDVAKVHATRDGVYFQTFTGIFHWTNRGMRLIRPETRFHLSFMVGGRVFVRQEEIGLTEVVGDSLRPLPGGERFGDSRIYAMLPYGDENILIVTRSEGLFLYDFHSATPLHTPANSLLIDRQAYHGTRLSDGTFAIATIRGGVVVLDENGRVVTVFDKQAGLQDENIWYVAADADDGLWLALNNGLARVEYPSPLSNFDERTGLSGAVSSIARHDNRLFAATALGLFSLNDRDSRSSSDHRVFRQVPGTALQCWDLLPFHGSLLAATDHGVFALTGEKLVRITDQYSYSLAPSVRDPQTVFVGLQSGVMTLRARNGVLNGGRILPGIGEEIRSIAETPDGNLWLSTRFQGVLRVAETGGSPVVVRFDTRHGLPPVVGEISILYGRIVVDTEVGILSFDKTSGEFVLDPLLATIPERVARIFHRPVDLGGGRTMVEGENGYFAVSPASGGPANVVRESPLSRIRQNVELTIYNDPDGVLWFGGSDGIVRYDSRIDRKFGETFGAFVRRVATVERDSLVFAGTGFEHHPPLTFQGEAPEYRLPYEANALRFEYAATSYDVPGATHYQYFLSGFDDDWSLPTTESRKDYTNLPPHWFTFRVRAVDVYGQISQEDSFTFRVLPPWYRRWWAYTLYVIFSGLGVYGFLRLRTAELERKNRILEEKVEVRTVQLRQKSDDLARSNKELEVEKRKSDSLLYNILPEEVAEELKGAGTTTPSRFDEVSIMFTDFKGFSEVVSRLPAAALVAELSDIYQHFDDIIEHYGIEKIKTIGDSYMIAAGLPKPMSDHAVRCVNAARDMLSYLSGRNEHTEYQWTMRVGIHTGPVLAGVVGKIKFTYDVWGDTVNIASRMESSGEAGRINVSAQTHDLIKSVFSCEPRGKVQAKGKGLIEMFFVDGGTMRIDS